MTPQCNPAALQRAREVTGLTQSELAKHAGVGRSTVKRLEAGRSPGRVSSLVKLAKALDVPLETLHSHGSCPTCGRSS